MPMCLSSATPSPVYPSLALHTRLGASPCASLSALLLCISPPAFVTSLLRCQAVMEAEAGRVQLRKAKAELAQLEALQLQHQDHPPCPRPAPRTVSHRKDIGPTAVVLSGVS